MVGEAREAGSWSVRDGRVPRRVGLAAPPACDYLPSLILPDLARARLLARAAQWVDVVGVAHAGAPDRARGAAPEGPVLVHVDLGAQGFLADETAAVFAAEHCDEVFVLGEPQLHDAFGMLVAALRARGLRIAHAAPDEGALAALASWWQRCGGSPPATVNASAPDAAPTDAPMAATGGVPAHVRPWPELLLTRADEAVPAAHGIVFEEQPDGSLLRRSPGPAGCVRAEVDVIHVHTSEQWTEAALRTVAPTDLVALRLGAEDAESASTSAAIARMAALRARFGPARVRLAVDRVSLTTDARCGGAPWAARLRLDGGSTLSRVLAGVPGHAPTDTLTDATRGEPTRAQRRQLAAALAWQALGVDPLEEIYAGNALPDRNAAMLVNIVP